MRRGSRKDLMIVQGPPVMGLIAVMRRALAYWRPYWVQGLLIVAATLLQQAFNTFLALSLKLIIDRALAARDGVLLLWRLALLFMVGLPLIMVATRAFTPRAARANYQRKQDQGQLASTVHEYVRAQPVVKVFGLQDSLLAHFRDELAGIARSTVRANFLTLLVGTGSSLGVLLVQLVALGAGALLALHGHLTVGALVACMSLLSSVNKDAYNLTKKVVPSLITATGGLQRIEALLSQRPRLHNG